MEGLNFENRKFNSKEEELSFLREYLAKKEGEIEKSKSLEGVEKEVKKEKVVSQEVLRYSNNSPEEVLEKGALIPEKFREEIVLELAPEDHDAQMGELVGMLNEKGVINTLDVVSKMNNPHITDDFHRFLVQYLRSGYDVVGLKEKTPLDRLLRRSLFEITIGYDREENQDIQQFIGLMEELYTSMLSVADANKGEYITVEVSKNIKESQFVIYISVPNVKTELLEKQVSSFFPSASIVLQTNDFNIFNDSGVSRGVYLKQKEVSVKNIRTYSDFNVDPMKAILGVFSKLDQDSEGIALQLVFKPVGEFYDSKYRKALREVEKGNKSPQEIYIRNTTGSKLGAGFSKLVNGSPKKVEGEEINIDNELVEQIRDKVGKRVVSTNIRLVASASTEGRVNNIVNDVKSAFNQFDRSGGNSISFVDISKREEKNFFRKFSFREFDPSQDMPLNLSEVATLVHFPTEGNKVSPELKVNNMKTASIPVSASKSGIHIGTNIHRGKNTEVYFDTEDRMRHMYVIGQTGTGKTNMLKQMIIQDIHNGEGVCMIDPHGSDVQDVLANIPEERYDDVIYFDPSDIERPMGLNMLEYDVTKPEQKTFVVNELFSIFQKLYGANPESMGPMFEQYFRNATMLVIEDPDSGSTLLDVSRVLADSEYRERKIENCKNPVVKEFWTKIASKAGGEASLQNIVPYITSKFDVFLANDVMRPIVAQQKSSFNFREIMDNKKILLVNLSKGSLGDINANLIGLILVGKILMAALSRSDSVGKDFPPFYLYIDEFQNVTTDSISTILSEARKYRLSLNIAHQFIAQLNDGIKDSVFGNVGSMAIFRVGSDDAEFLERQLAPTFTAKDIMNIDNYNAYVKMLSGGVPIDPFSIKAPKSPEGEPSKIESLKKLSQLNYGRDKDEVEREISNRYMKQHASEQRENIGDN